MPRSTHTHSHTRLGSLFFFASETFSQFPAPLLPLLLMPPGSADDLSQLSPPASLLTSPAPALTTSTKLTSQACSAESVGGVRCCHLPPPPPPPPPLHWAPFQDQTACSLTHSLSLRLESDHPSHHRNSNRGGPAPSLQPFKARTHTHPPAQITKVREGLYKAAAKKRKEKQNQKKNPSASAFPDVFWRNFGYRLS